MDKICILLTCPMSEYLQHELAKRFTLIKSWQIKSHNHFLNQYSHSIKAIVANGVHGADSTLIESLPCLQIISSHSSGLDKIDLVKCKERGIRVTSVPDTLTHEVADLAVLLILSVVRRICTADLYVRNGLWKQGDFELTTKVSGKRVGIIGLGRIGSAIAKRLEAFDCPISYYSRSEKPNSRYKYYPNVIELASNCEILVIACSLTKQTYHMINREVIDALGPKGYVINIGRGAVIDERELVLALVERRLAGAGLDVFEHEPDVPVELVGLDNVVLSPHVGTCTVETRKAMADLVVANLVAYFTNEPLLTPVV
ncbi:hypothetical protein QVD17_25614 [Tagetes erecta]|uniref:Hydroxyphenylpyruvate reductase n=1 Tax=Tagetes erecta TaxID=13708 RepID=A0AAD8KGR0_TARER|nr:hypothetical protein QVD17_25614 [Tagetes erecta]